uniref:Uncharacterized protein n=1 Tax=Cacopsylla melanoneura TaxID=428564 RepID=A0A8D9FE08_9HEMI
MGTVSRLISFRQSVKELPLRHPGASRESAFSELLLIKFYARPQMVNPGQTGRPDATSEIYHRDLRHSVDRFLEYFDFPSLTCSYNQLARLIPDPGGTGPIKQIFRLRTAHASPDFYKHDHYFFISQITGSEYSQRRIQEQD